MKILLVSPYKMKLAPLGLMRISSWHKSKGDSVVFVEGNKEIDFIPDKIYITTLFTYEYPRTIKCVRYYRNKFKDSEIVVGGILASFRPELFEKEGVKVHIGLLKEVEDFPPDYDLFPEVNCSITFSSRGCIQKCGFCVVNKMEGMLYPRDWVKDINPKFKKIVFLDNNWTAKSKEDRDRDIEELWKFKNMGVNEIDYNQSISCILFSEEIAKSFKGLPITPMRFSFDHMGQDGHIQRAIKLSKEYKFSRIHVDVLYNWTDTPEDFYYRLKELAKLKVTAIPMRYVPLTSLNRKYIGEKWTRKESFAVNKINPYSFGQISPHTIEEFEYFFGKTAEEFKKLLNYKKIKQLTQLKLKKMSKDKIKGLTK